MPKQDIEECQNEETVAPTLALVMDLDNIIVAGREQAFEVLKAELKSARIELTPALFARFCLGDSLVDSVQDVFEFAGKDIDGATAVADAAGKKIEAAFADGGLTVNPALSKLTAMAKKEDVKLIAFSCLDAEAAATLSEKAGLSEQGIEVRSIALRDNGVPSTEAWKRICHEFEVSPYCAIAVVSHSAFSRSALAAHLRCVAVPDRFTAFQDFGGADTVLDALDHKAIKALIDDLNAR